MSNCCNNEFNPVWATHTQRNVRHDPRGNKPWNNNPVIHSSRKLRNRNSIPQMNAPYSLEYATCNQFEVYHNNAHTHFFVLPFFCFRYSSSASMSFGSISDSQSPAHVEHGPVVPHSSHRRASHMSQHTMSPSAISFPQATHLTISRSRFWTGSYSVQIMSSSNSILLSSGRPNIPTKVRHMTLLICRNLLSAHWAVDFSFFLL